MARNHDTAAYKKLLLHFMGESDPLYSMLQWLTERMMEVEAIIRDDLRGSSLFLSPRSNRSI